MAREKFQESHVGMGKAGNFGILPLGAVPGNSQGEPYCRVDICIKIQISISLKTIVSRGFGSREKRDVDNWREGISASVEKTNELAPGESLS